MTSTELRALADELEAAANLVIEWDCGFDRDSVKDLFDRGCGCCSSADDDAENLLADFLTLRGPRAALQQVAIYRILANALDDGCDHMWLARKLRDL